MMRIPRFLLDAGLTLAGAVAPPPVHAATEPAPAIEPDSATVSIDFAKSRGPRFEAERYNNVSRPTTFTAARNADVRFLNEQGLHGQTYRVWIDAHLIHDEKTGRYNFAMVEITSPT